MEHFYHRCTETFQALKRIPTTSQCVGPAAQRSPHTLLSLVNGQLNIALACSNTLLLSHTNTPTEASVMEKAASDKAGEKEDAG